MKSFSIRTPSFIPAKASLPAPAQTSRPLDVSVVILPLLLLGFLLARFAAPLFKLLPGCAFRQMIGIPCPSCGATRAGLALAQGDLMGALSYNPLFVVSLGLLFGWSVFRLFERWSGKSISGRFVRKMMQTPDAPPANAEFKIQQRLRWLAIGAIALNWLYLIATT